MNRLAFFFLPLFIISVCGTDVEVLVTFTCKKSETFYAKIDLFEDDDSSFDADIGGTDWMTVRNGQLVQGYDNGDLLGDYEFYLLIHQNCTGTMKTLRQIHLENARETGKKCLSRNDRCSYKVNIKL